MAIQRLLKNLAKFRIFDIMKCIATLNFWGINELQGNHKQGCIYEFEDNETTALLLKVGYIKKVEHAIKQPEKIEVIEVKEVKEVKEVIETKELKVKKTTKKKNG
jgi:hypothetical protein